MSTVAEDTHTNVDASEHPIAPFLRMDRMPAVEVHIVPSAEPPTGVGEPATPVIAPAVANAVYDAVGLRIPYACNAPPTARLTVSPLAVEAAKAKARKTGP